eukprot:gene11161-11311_t
MKAVGLCSTLFAVKSLTVQINGLHGSINSPVLEQTVTVLHDCGLADLQLEGNFLTGSLTDFWGQLVNLRFLNLEGNRLQGTLPNAICKLTNLTGLSFSGNPMHGTLPACLGQLGQLQFLLGAALSGTDPITGKTGLVGTLPSSLANLTNLTVLSLGVNPNLEGTLPANLCRAGLEVISLGGCQLSGNITELFNCHGLQALDISSNRFSGTLPDLPYWLSGTIHRFIRLLQNLNALMLSGNQLSGSIDGNLFHLPRISLMDLSRNKLTGTISSAIENSITANLILLSSNQLEGQIPSALSKLNRLTAFDVRNNSKLSCGSRDAAERCDRDNMLPCFLQLSNITMPRSDDSNMECPIVLKKAPDEVAAACGNLDGPQQALWWQEQRSLGLANMGKASQDWMLDPNYYQYSGCKCLKGFHEIWDKNTTALACIPDTSTAPEWLTALIATLSVFGFLLLMAAALLVWFRMAVQLRNKWHREKELNRHRQLGVPQGGLATIVVTDVEQYSDLARLQAAFTCQALVLHDAILRKAAAIHAGYVIEQEGDSWSIAFHSAVEAVGFCLQVQQALQKCRWPSERAEPDQSQDSMLGIDTRPEYLSENLLWKASGTGKMPSRRASLSVKIKGTRAGRSSGWTASGSTPDTEHGSHPMPSRTNQSSTQKSAAAHQPLVRQSTVSFLSGIWARGGRAGTLLSDGRRCLVVPGLRVRMGVATGHVPQGTAITRCALFQLAKGVSESCNGGQVLLELTTCEAIRHRLSELSSVSHNGYEDKLWAMPPATSAIAHIQHSDGQRGLKRLLARLVRAHAAKAEPVLLDMGEFHMPGMTPTLQATALAAIPASVGSADATLLPAPSAGPSLLAPVTMVFAAVDGGRALVNGKPDTATFVDGVLSRIMQALLLVMPDGYLCRQQPGALRYMLAFKDPARAVKWCLMLQEVLQHIPWSSEALEDCSCLPQPFVPETPPQLPQSPPPINGIPVKRPCLKIGLAEGIPDSISLDHLGRADYFGSSVNLAARMMDIAACGGQVVASSGLAESVFSTWTYEADMGLHHHTTDDIIMTQPGSLVLSSPSQHKRQNNSLPGFAQCPVKQPGRLESHMGIIDAVLEAADDSLDGNTEHSVNGGLAVLTAVDDGMINPAAPGSPLLKAAAMSMGSGRLYSNSSYLSRLVHVSAEHIGTYAFKGCGAVDMVCFATDASVGSPQQRPAALKGDKGRLVMASSGPVWGLQDCPVLVPDVLSALIEAWKAARRQA